MVTSSESELPTASPETPILQWSGQRRFKYFLTGIIGPIGCFVATWCGMNVRFTSLWQSGELDVYLKLMLEPKELLPFIPLLIYSMLGLGACCVNVRWARKLWVRIGVYGGGILSAQYLIFVVFAGSFFPLVCAAIVGPSLALVTYIAAKLMPRARRITIFQIMLLTTVVAAVAAVCASLGPQLTASGIFENIFGLLFWTMAAVPLLNCVTYVRAASALLRSPALAAVSAGEKRRLLGLSIGWMLGFGASWKFALDAMLAEYAKLPTSPPQCYISSAAAYGHRQFVGVAGFSQHEQVSDSPATFPINAQMCRLKFLEFALLAFSPGWHRFARSFYDAIGPRAAAFCRSNVWFADASYIALKPIELLACLVQNFSQVSQQQVFGLYLRGRSGSSLRRDS